MTNELELANNGLAIEKFTIISLEKLDNNYIRIIGKRGYRDIDVVTNGIFALNFSPFSKVKKVITYGEVDYLIAENIYSESFLISLNDGVRLIKRVKEINYIEDGLFGISEKKDFSTEKVFDLNTNKYISFPDDMIFKSYKDGVLTLQESNKASYEKHKEMVIDRNGNIIIPRNDGRIRIINNTKFIFNNMIIDLNQKIIIQDADLIMPLTDDKIIKLKNRKLFILNNALEVIKTYTIGETKKPWYTSVNSDECITMTFKKKIRPKKYEPRIEKDITVMINTKTDTVSKMNFVPSFSPYEVFTITGSNHKKGLMNKKGEIILNAEYDNIKALHDSDNKYFFLEKDDNHYIFNAKTKSIIKVSYTEMEEFKDGLAIGYIPKPTNYQLVNEELNPIFNLEYMGSSRYYYKNGILCYNSNSWANEDNYTIITQFGEVLMSSRKCQVKRNGFELLEIHDDKTGKNALFDMNKGQFVQLEINVPVIETENGQQFDFSRFPIKQLFQDTQAYLVLQEDNIEHNKKMILNNPNDKDIN